MKKLFSKYCIIFLITAITVNADAQWVKLDSVKEYDYQQVFFINNDTGYILVGGLLLKTNNGAISWEILDNLNSGGYSMFFIDENIGFIAAGSGIKKTINGGYNWTTNSELWGMDAIIFVNDSVGYTAGSGRSAKTTDQGKSWNLLTSTPNYNIKSIYFVNDLIGYIFGYHGEGFKTMDGGETWIELNTSTGADIWSSFFINEQIGYIMTSALGSGMVLKTENGGNSWYTIISINLILHSVFFTCKDTGYVVGGYIPRASDPMILKTTDGGNTWINQNPANNPSKAIKSIYFVNNCVGYAVGSDGLILKTTNAGDSTLCLETPPKLFYLFQNYPNPFNNETTIDYHLPVDTKVQLKIYNILGQEVRTLIDTFQTVGEKEVIWNGKDNKGNSLSSGLYICVLLSGSGRYYRKMLFLK